MSKNARKRHEKLTWETKPDPNANDPIFEESCSPEPFPEGTPMADANRLDDWKEGAQGWR